MSLAIIVIVTENRIPYFLFSTIHLYYHGMVLLLLSQSSIDITTIIINTLIPKECSFVHFPGRSKHTLGGSRLNPPHDFQIL